MRQYEMYTWLFIVRQQRTDAENTRLVTLWRRIDVTCDATIWRRV